MTRFTTVLSATALALAFGATAVLAQTPSTGTPSAGTTKAAPTTAAKKAPVPKVATTEAGKKCSADADAQKLHGKPRRAFRSKCVREFKATAAKKV